MGVDSAAVADVALLKRVLPAPATCGDCGGPTALAFRLELDGALVDGDELILCEPCAQAALTEAVEGAG